MINKELKPVTPSFIVDGLIQIGVHPGMTILVHSSLKSLGWVCGGAVTVIQALMEVVTETGTIVMPAYSPDYTDPSRWRNPPVPGSCWQTIRESMPAYDPSVTPTRKMGAIAECFRKWPGVIRSSHPAASFAAWGGQADRIVGSHPLDFPLGEESPLARLYELDGWVLLLGVGFDSNTSFHLAEHRLGGRKEITEGGPILENGKRIWKAYRDIETREDSFGSIGKEFETLSSVKKGKVASAQILLFRLREAVEFAQAWFQRRLGSRIAPTGVEA